MQEEHVGDGEPIVESAEQVDQDRREALVRMGKFAAYTTPAMLTLLTSDEAVAWKGSGQSGGSGKGQAGGKGKGQAGGKGR